MPKRTFFMVFLMIAAAFGLAGGDLKLESEPFPTGVDLSWNPVEGAVFYDIYADNIPIVRLDADADSYQIRGLESGREYQICVAARDSVNNDIAVVWDNAATGSWDGIYRWENRTDDDNRGRMKEMTLRIETGHDNVYGQFLNIFIIEPDGTEVRIFPLYPLGSAEAGKWEDYNGDSIAAVAYRINAEKLNTSVMKPSRWRLDRIVIDYDSTSAYIQTSALGLTFDMEVTCRFFMEDGVQKIAYETKASGIANAILFRNPNPDEGDAFIFSKI